VKQYTKLQSFIHNMNNHALRGMAGWPHWIRHCSRVA